VVADQPVRRLVLGAQVDPEPVLGVVGVGAGARAQIRDQPVAGPDPQDPARPPLAERDREIGEIPVLDDLLAAAEQLPPSFRVFLSSSMSVAQMIVPANFWTPNPSGITPP
jgi:hypothetical protein